MISETAFTSQWLRAMLQNHDSQKPILDVGSGGSVYGSHLPDHIGIDLQDPSPILEKQLFKKMNAIDLKFVDGAFSTVICHNLANYCGYAAYGHEPFDYGPEKLVLECLRVLAEDGLFLFEAPVGVSGTTKGPMGIVKTFSLGEFNSLLIGGEIVEQAFYVKQKSKYQRVGAEHVTSAVHVGYSAGAAGIVLIRRDDSELPTLEEFAQRIPSIPDPNEPVSPEVEDFQEGFETHEQQIAKARTLG